MLETVVTEKPVRRAAPPPTSPRPASDAPPAAQPRDAPQQQQQQHQQPARAPVPTRTHSAFESANERLRGIFHRAATLDAKKAAVLAPAPAVAAPPPEKEKEKAKWESHKERRAVIRQKYEQKRKELLEEWARRDREVMCPQ